MVLNEKNKECKTAIRLIGSDDGFVVTDVWMLRSRKSSI